MSSIGDSLQKLREKMNSLGKRGGGGGGDSGGGKAPKFDAKKAMGWVKRNPVIVLSVAVMLLAPAAAWWFSNEMNVAAAEQTKKRADEMTALERLEKTSVEITLPGQQPMQQSGVVTPKVVAAYQELNRRLHEDAVAVQKAALARNQNGRTKLAVDIRVTPSNSATIVADVRKGLLNSVANALSAARAGMPPADEEVVDQVKRRQDQYIVGQKKESRKALTAEELAQLNQALAEKRLQVYADAASKVSFYADIDRLGLQMDADSGGRPSEAAMFFWQWRAWIVQDILQAISDCNKPFRSVIDAPVKHLESIRFIDAKTAESFAAPAKPGAGGAGGAGEAPAEGAAAADAAAAAAAGPPPLDPKAEVAYDFKSSFTGRTTNKLYEVRRFQVTMVVSTQALPEVLNALSNENFMTVYNMVVKPADPFADASDGFIYGADPVSLVRFDIESVWLREWLAKLMPKELQDARGSNGRTMDDMAASASAPATNG